MRSFLYHDSNPSRPVIYLLKYFCLWFRLCKYICISQILCGVIKQKSHVSRDFRPLFVFYDLNPSGPLINRIKYFWIRFRFHWDIQIFKKPLSVHHTAESSSAVCIIPRSQAPRCASYPAVRLRSVHHITESWKKVYKKTSQSASYQESDWCESYCGVNNLQSVCFNPTFYDCYFSVMHTAESSDPNFSKNSMVCIIPQSQAQRCAFRGVRIEIFENLWLL